MTRADATGCHSRGGRGGRQVSEVGGMRNVKESERGPRRVGARSPVAGRTTAVRYNVMLGARNRQAIARRARWAVPWNPHGRGSMAFTGRAVCLGQSWPRRTAVGAFPPRRAEGRKLLAARTATLALPLRASRLEGAPPRLPRRARARFPLPPAPPPVGAVPPAPR